MAASSQRLVTERKQSLHGKVTTHSTRPMSFTAMEEVEIKTDYLHLKNEYDWLDNLFLSPFMRWAD